MTSRGIIVAQMVSGIRYFPVGPSNDQELAIARIIDRIAIEGRLDLAAIQEIVNVLDFLMTGSDSEFLERYIQWRITNPIAK